MTLAPAAPAPAPVRQPTPAPRPKCGVCHSPILAGEAETGCPSCGLRFHAECWQENYGCSAYGCPQVDALKPPEPEPAADGPGEAPANAPADADVAPPPATPWGFLLFGLSVLGAVASAVSFGAASLAMLAVSMTYLVRTRRDANRKAGPVYGAIAFSVVGMFGGAAVSYLLFLHHRR